MFSPFHKTLADVAGTIRKNAEVLKRPVIGVMPAYFPMEIIHAAGGYPVQLWGNNRVPQRAEAYLQSYCCSLSRSVLDLELRGGADMVAAYAFTSLCDTLINLREIYGRIVDKPTLQLSIPITSSVEARKAYLQNVLVGITDRLKVICGKKPDAAALQASVDIYARMRGLQQKLYAIRRQKPGLIKNHDFYAVIKAGFFLPVEIYHHLLVDLVAALETAPVPEGDLPKLVLSGMVFDPIEIYKDLDRVGVAVVDDDFANGWHSAAKARLDTTDLVAGVSQFLFSGPPCCCIYNPDNDRHLYLIDKVKTSGADGVVFWYLKFCEPDAFDRPQLMAQLKAAGIPAMEIELELSMHNFNAVVNRIEAFCEMIKGVPV